MKQKTLFGQDVYQEKNVQKYSTKIEAPIYEPKNKKPHPLELCDNSKTLRLIREIEINADISDDDKRFLIKAAQRHLVFNYEKIADYYAHSSTNVQKLMERSGLVIIDFEDAIQYGYVKLCNDIHRQYLEEYEK